MPWFIVHNSLIIPYLIIILSLAGLAFIVYRKIPTLIKLPAEPDENSLPGVPLREKTVNLIKTIAHPNFWLVFLGWLEKTLRKTRILFLKLDNFFISLIAKSREKSHEMAIKSKEWMSESRMKKIGKLKMMADLRRTSEEKEEMLLSILKQNPRDIKAYKDLGQLYMDLGNIHDAESAFKEALKINPEDETAILKLEEIKTKEESGQ